MTEVKSPTVSRYFGLPNGAAKAYFVCQQYLNHGKSALFISHEDRDDFDNAAREFAPRGAQTFTFPDTDTGRVKALYQLCTSTDHIRLVSLSYSALCVPLPAPDLFKQHIFTIRSGDTLRRQ